MEAGPSGASLSVSPSPPQLKKRALDQLRLVKPKHVGGSAGDCPEQLLMEPCSGEHTAAEAGPVLVSGRVHIWGVLWPWRSILPARAR